MCRVVRELGFSIALTITELTRHAMDQLVPRVVGPLNEKELYEALRRIHIAGLAAYKWE
jgi:hypothetical protein